MARFNRNGIWFTVKDGCAADVAKYLHLAANDLQALKDRTPGSEIRYYNRPGMWRILSSFGRDEIYMTVSEGIPTPKKKVARTQEVEAQKYVLLVEMGSGPGAFAVFEPSGNGIEAGATGGSNLTLVGWTNQMLEDSLDPKGISGQETFRQKWCRDFEFDIKGIPFVGVEQVKRVDQGYYAYTGDRSTEEVTSLVCSNYWDYTGIDHPTVWESVDPGPPPPEICGYTWSIPAVYGGAGDGEYEDLEHLFYMVKTGNNLSYWWPPNFNQYLAERQYHNDKGVCARYIDGDEGDSLPNTDSLVRVEQNRSRRIWGCVYLQAEDYAINSHPYATGTALTDYQICQTLSGHSRDYKAEGVYVKDQASAMFMQGYMRDSGYEDGTYLRMCKRELADPNNLPYGAEEYEEGNAVGILFEQFNDPSSLTAEQLAILLGNEDAYDDWVGPGAFEPNLYDHVEGFYAPNPGQMVMNCGGVEHIVADSYLVESYVYQRLQFNHYREFEVMDYGIFTKDNKGISPENTIVPSEVEPIYAFSMDVWDEGTDARSNEKIIYGMVLDGKLYRTEEFAKTEDGYDIGCRAKDKAGQSVAATYNVRVGIRKTKVYETIEE